MSNKDFKVMKMEVEKWYVCDGAGKTTTLPAVSERNTEKPTTKETDCDKNKIVPIEPKWKQEEPKNCFSPF